MNFAQRLAQLPAADHIAVIELFDPNGEAVGRLVNQPGQKGSVVVYAALAALYQGRITPAAAQLGLEWYGEHVADAQANPGYHPNIDRLLSWAQGQTAYTARVQMT